jgi:diacylglycerol kinase (ATP)
VNDRFTVSARVRSFGHATRGIWIVLRGQHNAWIHALATVVVVGLGLGLGVGTADWCWLVLALTAVWACEAFNTALEHLADAASPGFHPLVRQAKDAAAGAVLIAAVGATVIGVLVLGPPLLSLAGLAD